jgi:hypothetical protein
MPRIRHNGARPLPRPELLDELARELRASHPSGQPRIEEYEFPATGAVRTSVLWDRWHDVPDDQRVETILEAYESVEGRGYRDRIALAVAVTTPEAFEAGMLPFEVQPALRRDDPVTHEQVVKAMLAEGASQLFSSRAVRLLYATEQEAEAAVERLSQALPGSKPIWTIARILVPALL